MRVLSESCLTEEDKQKVNNGCNLENKIDSIIDEPAAKKLKPDLKNNGDNNDEEIDGETTVVEESTKKLNKNDDRKEKLKGQNKSRPPPFKTSRDRNLCPWIVDQAVDELEKKCPTKKCAFIHDRAEYLKIKEPDVGNDCYLFNLTGKCPRGVACRFASKHSTENGLNIVNKEKFEEFKKKSPTTKNKIPPSLQDKLRKRKYNFSNAEKIIKASDASRQRNDEKKKPCNGNNKNNSSKLDVFTTTDDENDKETPIVIVKDEPNENKRLGPVADDDLIKLRSCEKKKITWSDKILLSPLTTVGNLPFRRICKEYGADITCGEMALAPKVLKGAPEEWALVKRHECEDIFGVQLCGNNPGVLTRCAQLLNEQAEIDFVDLNLGCPIDLIYKQGGGSGMLNRSNILQTVVKSVSQVLDVPLTIKTRMGVYMDKPIAHNLMPKFRDWGASMITVSN